MTKSIHLNKAQKESITLLSIGTFLEYFDLMLYVHMAVFLNELFFPKTDEYTQSLLTAFAFCSTYLLRPLGALIFGYLGDKMGRKSTVIITTIMMSISCFIMANLPTYAQIGITASWFITLCRIFQGLSSMGEVIGAGIYLTEMVKPPLQNVAVSSIFIASTFGGFSALGCASLINYYGINWRLAFWIGAIIAIVGIQARTRLRETPEFANAKKRLEDKLTHLNQDPKLINTSSIIKMTVPYKTLWAYFFIECSWPACFYLKVMYLGTFLVTKFGYSGADVIYHNFQASFFGLIITPIMCWLSYYIHPLNILRYIITGFSIIILFLPYILNHIDSPYQVLMLQCCMSLFWPTAFPANAVFYNHLPVFKRFTYSSVIYAMSRSIMSLVTSVGFVMLINNFGYIGLYIIFIPIIIGFVFGINHFINLEKEKGLI